MTKFSPCFYFPMSLLALMLVSSYSRAAAETTAAPLLGTQAVNFMPGVPEIPPNTPEIAQVYRDEENISGPNYLGVGLHVGFNDTTSALGGGGFAVLSKFALSRQVSVRPGVVFGTDPVIELPLTIDFPIKDTDEDLQVNVAPYLGGGLAVSVGDNTRVGGFGTVGIDAGLTPQFTATAALKVGFIEEAEVGITVGGSLTF